MQSLVNKVRDLIIDLGENECGSIDKRLLLPETLLNRVPLNCSEILHFLTVIKKRIKLIQAL